MGKGICTCIILFSLFIGGCEESTNYNIDVNEKPKKNYEITEPEKVAQELSNKSINDFELSSSVPYNVLLKVYTKLDEYNDKKMSFEIIVDKPLLEMNKVSITALLHESMYKYLDASFLWFSNLDLVNDKYAPDYMLTLSPNPTNNEIKGIINSRSFILIDDEDFNNVEKSQFLDDIAKSKVKVTWLDKNSNLNTSYFRFDTNDIAISPEVFND